MMPRLLTTAWIVGLLWLTGCNYPLIRSQSPESEDLAYLAEEEPDDGIELIGDKTMALGQAAQNRRGRVGQRVGQHRQ